MVNEWDLMGSHFGGTWRKRISRFWCFQYRHSWDNNGDIVNSGQATVLIKTRFCFWRWVWHCSEMPFVLNTIYDVIWRVCLQERSGARHASDIVWTEQFQRSTSQYIVGWFCLQMSFISVVMNCFWSEVRPWAAVMNQLPIEILKWLLWRPHSYTYAYIYIYSFRFGYNCA